MDVNVNASQSRPRAGEQEGITMARRKAEEPERAGPMSDAIPAEVQLDYACVFCSGTGRSECDAHMLWRRVLQKRMEGGQSLADAVAGVGPEPEMVSVPCGHCDGEGRIVTNFGREVLDFLDRHAGPGAMNQPEPNGRAAEVARE